MAMTWEAAMDKRTKRKAVKVKSLGKREEKRKNDLEALLVRKRWNGSEVEFEVISSKSFKVFSQGHESEESARAFISLESANLLAKR